MQSTNSSQWDIVKFSTPASSADLTPTTTPALTQGRIISYGARATYTGTTLNQSGMITCFVDPNHNTLNPATGSGPSTVTGRPGFVRRPITRSPCTLSISAIDAHEMEYPDLSDNVSGVSSGNFTCPFSNYSPFNLTTNATGGPPAAVYINGAQPGATFDVEIIQHYELIGSSVGDRVTNSTPDTRGAEIVLAAAQRVGSIMEASPSITSSTAFQTALGNVMREVVPKAASAVFRYATSRGSQNLIEL